MPRQTTLCHCCAHWSTSESSTVVVLVSISTPQCNISVSIINELNIVPWSTDEAQAIVEQAKQFGSNLNEKLLSTLAQVSSVDFSPVTSVIGGLMTHEIVKAVTRRGNPIEQILFYECSHVLPQVPPQHDPSAQVRHSLVYLKQYLICYDNRRPRATRVWKRYSVEIQCNRFNSRRCSWQVQAALAVKYWRI